MGYFNIAAWKQSIAMIRYDNKPDLCDHFSWLDPEYVKQICTFIYELLMRNHNNSCFRPNVKDGFRKTHKPPLNCKVFMITFSHQPDKQSF